MIPGVGGEPESESVTRATRADVSSPTIESGDAGSYELPMLPAGTLVGRYVVEERIGAGGMGVVFRARDPALDRVVALKCLRPEYVALHGESRLVREARGMAQLSHPNVVAVYGVEHQHGSLMLAMEHVHGKTLREWLGVPRPWPEIVGKLLDAGRGLAAAHAAGLVHRDFKPSNVLVGDDDRVRVMDFGLVRVERGRDTSVRSLDMGQAQDSGVLAVDELSDDGERTQAGILMGTVAYMALEQLEGHDADARSDQFAFCVSLWEALCGERPFGSDPKQSRKAKRLGPPAWPTKVVVPVALIALVRRGMAPRPEDRWPSMAVLLGRLERLGPKRRRASGARWLLGSTIVVAGGLGLGVWQAPERSTCTGAQERLDAVWDARQAEALRDNLGAAGAVHLEETWPRVQHRLDDYAARWVAAHTEACEATTVRGEVEPVVLDQRMACLDRDRVELRAMVQLLAAPGAETAERAVALVASLPSPDHCIDAPATHGELPPPSDPAVAAEVAALRDALTEVKALQLARAYDEALAELEPLVERARASGYGPIEAVALFRRGKLHEARGEYAVAEADLLRAHALGVEHGYAKVVQQAASQLAFVVGHRQARPEEGLRWANAAVAEAGRLGLGGVLEADALESLAVVLHMQGRYDEAVAEQRRALELLQEAADSGTDRVDELEIASFIDALGNMVSEQGKSGEAIELHRRALAIRERELGPSHLDVAASLNNLGSAMMGQGREAEAIPHLRRTLEIRERVLGPDDRALVSVLVNLGAALEEGERPQDAEPVLLRALALAKAGFGEDHPYVGSALINLGGLYEHLGDREGARLHYRRCLDTWERTLGSEHPKLAIVLASLGDLALAEGGIDQAAQRHERALSIREAALGHAHPLVARSRVDVGRVRLAQGQAELALSDGRLALATLEELADAEPEIAGDAHALVGRALLALNQRDEGRRELELASRLHPALAEELSRELEAPSP
jgi:tetratricopeptide (TPR) repeat protein